MTVLKWMLKLALLPLLLLLILAQWVGIFLTTFSTILTNLLAGLFFFVALASWVMKLADGGEVLKMLISIVVLGTPKEWNVSRRNFTPTSFFSFLWAAAALW